MCRERKHGVEWHAFTNDRFYDVLHTKALHLQHGMPFTEVCVVVLGPLALKSLRFD